MRTRLTWAKTDRKASPGPATPGYNEPETLDHPAAYEDPGPHDYENGDTSSWAEDPTKGPYPNSKYPALPGTEEPQGHPATDPKHYFPRGVSASLVRQMEKKAARCIRIAKSMLGRTASAVAVEDQAVDLMSLPDRQIQATLARLAEEDGEKEEEKDADDLMVEEDEDKADKKAEDESDDSEDDSDDEETAGKKAARFQRLASYWTNVAKKAGEVPEAFKKQWDKADDKKDDKKEEAKKEASLRARKARKASEATADQNDPKSYNFRQQGKLAEGEDEDEALLAAMLDDETKSASDDEDEALLAAMLDEGMTAGDEDSDEDAALLAEMLKEDAPSAEDMKAEDKAAMLGDDEQAMLDEMMNDDSILDGVAVADPVVDDLSIDEDPMGLIDTGFDDMELNSLYGSKFAGDEEKPEEKKEEKPADKAEEKPSKEAKSKTAAVRPQPRKASTGVKAIGSVPTVSGDRDVEALSKLWESAPNISDIFK